MIVQSALIGDLISQKLSMMPGSNTLINDFLLIIRFSDVSRDELGHLHVVSEDIQRQFDTFGYSYEFVNGFIVER